MGDSVDKMIPGSVGNRSLKVAVVLSLAAISVAAPIAVGTPPAQAAARAPAVDSDVAAFYRQRGGAPLWFAPHSVGAAQQLLMLLTTARADGLNPNRYNVKGVA